LQVISAGLPETADPPAEYAAKHRNDFKTAKKINLAAAQFSGQGQKTAKTLDVSVGNLIK